MRVRRPTGLGRGKFVKEFGNGNPAAASKAPSGAKPSPSADATAPIGSPGRVSVPPPGSGELTQQMGTVPDELSIEKLRRYHAELGDLLERYDIDRGPFDRLSRHVRRHLPLYAMAAVFAMIVIFIPTTNRTGGVNSAITGAEGGSIDTGFGAEDGTVTPEEQAQAAGESVASRAGRLAGRAAGGAVGAVGAPAPAPGNKKIGAVKVGTGIARGGFECKPGVRQLNFSTYAFPCLAKFSGDNGGATYRGVDAKTIKFVVRKTADSGGPSAQTVDAANKAAGSATRTEYLEFAKKYWLPFFNKNMELFGRQVVIEEYGSTVSNGVDEAQSKGKSGACADATAIANNRKGFAVLAFTTGFGESQPFADCAKEKGGLLVPIAAAYFPEQWYQQKWHPYAYHIAMQCEQIAHDVAEYVGKRLMNKKAKWARNALYKNQTRVFGTYVPDNDGYQRCVNIAETDIKEKWGYKPRISRYNYPLDVARFPDSAAQGVLQFQRDGVTTLLNACDTISTRLMTEQADKVGWGPEWLIIGVATQDTNGAARGFNQNAIHGHLFGLSQLGPDAKIDGKDSEASRAFRLANPGVDPPQGALRVYYPMLHIFNLLQASGPILTPQNIYLGASKMPPGGGAKGAVGTWSLSGDHTEIDDSREVYWDKNKKGFDGKAGTFVETYGGARFGSGEWPREEPKIPVR